MVVVQMRLLKELNVILKEIKFWQNNIKKMLSLNISNKMKCSLSWYLSPTTFFLKSFCLEEKLHNSEEKRGSEIRR